MPMKILRMKKNRVSMPVYDFGVSAGTGVFLDNPCYEVISIPEDKLSRKLILLCGLAGTVWSRDSTTGIWCW